MLIVQLRDRPSGGWDHPFVTENIADHVTKPFLLLQQNWFKMMDYFQNDMLSYYTQQANHTIHKITFQYVTEKKEDKAALNFHLTQREKKNIMSSPDFPYNQKSFEQLLNLFNIKDTATLKPAE